jgi:hypothetical protein
MVKSTLNKDYSFVYLIGNKMDLDSDSQLDNNNAAATGTTREVEFDEA